MVPLFSLLLLTTSIIGAPSGSWSPPWTPEVKAATIHFVNAFNMVEEGGLAGLQAPQIPEFYLADLPDVTKAKVEAEAAFKAAQEGRHAELAPVNNDLQAPQIANAYIDDTAEVYEAKMKHADLFSLAEMRNEVVENMEMEPMAEPMAEPMPLSSMPMPMPMPMPLSSIRNPIPMAYYNPYQFTYNMPLIQYRIPMVSSMQSA